VIALPELELAGVEEGFLDEDEDVLWDEDVVLWDVDTA